MSNWPDATEYRNAVQNADKVFLDPRLRACRVQKKKNGLPWPRDGANAIVFKMEEPGGGAVAVRFFKANNTIRDQRYQILDAHLSRIKSPALVGFSFQPQGVRAGGEI